MSITNAEAQELIDMPKKIIDHDSPCESYVLVPHDNTSERYSLHSLDGNISFMMQIHQHFEQFKISLHLQENDRYIQLYRIDFHSPHKNPDKYNEFVPEFMYPFAGKRLEENHVHLFVESYKPLAWAIPLNVYDFKAKEVIDGNSLGDAIEEFCGKINIVTKVDCERRLFL